MLWHLSLLGTYSWKRTPPCDTACWNKWCCPLWGNGNCWQTIGVEIIYCRTVTSTTYSYISHNHENWFRALCNQNRRYSIISSQVAKMETWTVIILTAEDCIWTVKVFCSLLKIWLGVFGNYNTKKNGCVRKKYNRSHVITIPEYVQTTFNRIITQ